MTDTTRRKLMMHYPISKLHLVHSTITTFKIKLKAVQIYLLFGGGGVLQDTQAHDRTSIELGHEQCNGSDNALLKMI
jgi:glutamine amidotransferase-like uncharacterized protein